MASAGGPERDMWINLRRASENLFTEDDLRELQRQGVLPEGQENLMRQPSVRVLRRLSLMEGDTVPVRKVGRSRSLAVSIPVAVVQQTEDTPTVSLPDSDLMESTSIPNILVRTGTIAAITRSEIAATQTPLDLTFNEKERVSTARQSIGHDSEQRLSPAPSDTAASEGGQDLMGFTAFGFTPPDSPDIPQVVIKETLQDKHLNAMETLFNFTFGQPGTGFEPVHIDGLSERSESPAQKVPIPVTDLPIRLDPGASVVTPSRRTKKGLRNFESELELNDLRTLRMKFEEADTDGSGALNEEEFVAAFGPILGQHMSESDIRVLFMRIDADANGCIDWDELSEFLLLNSEQVLKASERVRLYYEEPEGEGLFTKPAHRDSHADHKSQPHHEEKEKESNVRTERQGKRGAIQKLICDPKRPKYYSFNENCVKLWNSTSNHMDKLIHLGKSWVCDINLIPQKDQLSVTSLDRTVLLYDTSTYEVLKAYKGIKKFKDDTRKQYTTIEKIDSQVKKIKNQVKEFVSLECGTLQDFCNDASCTTWLINKRSLFLIGMRNGQINYYNLESDPSSLYYNNQIACEAIISPHTDLISTLLVADRIESIVTSSHDATIKILNVETGVVTRTLGGEDIVRLSPKADKLDPTLGEVVLENGHTKQVTQCDWSDLLKLLTSCGVDRGCYVWNPFLRKPVAKLDNAKSPVVGCVFNSDENQIISVSRDKAIRIWDVRNYKCIQVITDKRTRYPEDTFGGVVLDRFKNAIVCTSAVPHVWPIYQNLSRYNCEHTGHKYPVLGVTFAPYFGQVVSADRNGGVLVFDLFDSPKSIMQWNVETGVSHISLDGNGRRLLVGTLNGELRIYNYTNAQLLKKFVVNQDKTKSELTEIGITKYVVQKSPHDIKWFIAADTHNRIHWFMDGDDEHSETCELGELGSVYAMCFVHPSVLVVGTDRGEVGYIQMDGMGDKPKIHRCSPMERRTSKQFDRPVYETKVQFQLGSTKVESYCGMAMGPLLPKPTPLFYSHMRDRPAESFQSNGSSYSKFVLSSSSNSERHFPGSTSVHTNDRLYKGMGQAVECLISLPAFGSFFASASGDGVVSLWDWRENRELINWTVTDTSSDAVYALCTDVDNRFLITGDVYGYITVYDISHMPKKTTKIKPSMISNISHFRAHKDSITSLVFVDSKSLIISSANDGSVCVCSVKGMLAVVLGEMDILPNLSDESTFQDLKIPHAVGMQEATQFYAQWRKMHDKYIDKDPTTQGRSFSPVTKVDSARDITFDTPESRLSDSLDRPVIEEDVSEVNASETTPRSPKHKLNMTACPTLRHRGGVSHASSSAWETGTRYAINMKDLTPGKYSGGFGPDSIPIVAVNTPRKDGVPVPIKEKKEKPRGGVGRYKYPKEVLLESQNYTPRSPRTSYRSPRLKPLEDGSQSARTQPTFLTQGASFSVFNTGATSNWNTTVLSNPVPEEETQPPPTPMKHAVSITVPSTNLPIYRLSSEVLDELNNDSMKYSLLDTILDPDGQLPGDHLNYILFIQRADNPLLRKLTPPEMNSDIRGRMHSSQIWHPISKSELDSILRASTFKESLDTEKKSKLEADRTKLFQSAISFASNMEKLTSKRSMFANVVDAERNRHKIKELRSSESTKLLRKRMSELSLGRKPQPPPKTAPIIRDSSPPPKRPEGAKETLDEALRDAVKTGVELRRKKLEAMPLRPHYTLQLHKPSDTADPTTNFNSHDPSRYAILIDGALSAYTLIKMGEPEGEASNNAAHRRRQSKYDRNALQVASLQAAEYGIT